MFYARDRNTFGCTADPCDCRRHLTIEGIPATFDARLVPRIKHITRIESLVNIGCKFQLDDLDADQWRDLLILATERQWMQAKVQEFRESMRGQDREVKDAQTEVRKAAGLPAPGQSLFSGGKKPTPRPKRP